MKNKITSLINQVANNKLSGKYNLAQYREGGSRYAEKQSAILHKNICESIVGFSNTHPNIPMYFILSVGISKGAYKESEFNKGYKSFNVEKVQCVYEMGQLYNKHNGMENRKMSDVTIRLMMRYYEKKSTNLQTFVKDLAKSKVLGKLCGSREIEYGYLCQNLNIPIKTNNSKLSRVA